MAEQFAALSVGQVIPLGAVVVEPKALAAFAECFAPDCDAAAGAPEAMVYALWSKLDRRAFTEWPEVKRLGVDALRWARTPPQNELLRGRMTIMAMDRVGDGKGIAIAQHDLIDESGRLVFSCLTRDVFGREIGDPEPL